ncbi:hypothetical protein ACO9S2_17555 [Nitrospira sp. NS4]|uniref:hypothetical protein n=1 Tax=Nitrospira sp. NS4 TaxID=3414498 RepID=UPI003C2BD91C
MADGRPGNVIHVTGAYTFLANPATLCTNKISKASGEGVAAMVTFFSDSRFIFSSMKMAFSRQRGGPHNSTLSRMGLALWLSVVFVPPGLSQTIPTPANPQNPSTQSLQAGVDISLLAVTPTVATTPSVSTVQGVATVPSSSRSGSLRSAGQGLPGMPGGPPLKGSLGYQDPSSSYMRPSTIGSLVCDPLFDGVCD